MMLRCGRLATKARIRPRSCQELTVHHALFASPSASAPRLPSDFCACSIAATASVKNSSSSAGSRSRSLVTTMTATAVPCLCVVDSNPGPACQPGRRLTGPGPARDPARDGTPVLEIAVAELAGQPPLFVAGDEQVAE